MNLNITDVLLFLNSGGILTLVIEVIKYRVATERRLARLETMMSFSDTGTFKFPGGKHAV